MVRRASTCAPKWCSSRARADNYDVNGSGHEPSRDALPKPGSGDVFGEGRHVTVIGMDTGRPGLEILYDAYGVPHITGATIADAAFGQGYASGEDHTCDLADQVVKLRGERARWLGGGGLPRSALFRNVERHSVITLPHILSIRIDESLTYLNARWLEDFVLDKEAFLLGGFARAELDAAGTPIGANDLLIAAHAIALDFVVVTGNEREFGRVPGLRIENWLR